MPRSSTLLALTDLTEEQGGLFTRAQAEATGMAWSTLARLERADVVERVAHGVYRLRGTAPDEHVDLRAAWLQLCPSTPAWRRTPEQGVVSHRSAAALFGLGHLPADVHRFLLPRRRQSRRPDVHVRRATLDPLDWRMFGGVLVTRPARLVSDLLDEMEDPGAVAVVAVEALRRGLDEREPMRRVLARHAERFGLRRDDGAAMLDWLVDLAGSSDDKA